MHYHGSCSDNICAGKMTYHYSAEGEGQSPFTRIGRVFAAAARNWRASHPVFDDKEAQGTQCCNGSQQFRFLDKALLAADGSTGCGKACSISEFEEAKAVLRLFPIWATSLIFAIILSQPLTLFVKQGVTLNRSIGPRFSIPPAALMSFVAICIIIFIPIYDRVFVPAARALTGKLAGITMLQRIGIGLFISIINMILAAAIEIKRLKDCFGTRTD